MVDSCISVVHRSSCREAPAIVLLLEQQCAEQASSTTIERLIVTEDHFRQARGPDRDDIYQFALRGCCHRVDCCLHGFCKITLFAEADSNDGVWWLRTARYGYLSKVSLFHGSERGEPAPQALH